MVEVRTVRKAKRSLRELAKQPLRAFDISSFLIKTDKHQQDLDNFNKNAMKTIYCKVLFETNSKKEETAKIYLNLKILDKKGELCWREKIDDFYWINCQLHLENKYRIIIETKEIQKFIMLKKLHNHEGKQT